MVPSVSLSKESKEGDGEVPVKTAIKNAIDLLRIYEGPLSPADKVMVMQGWNKVLAFKTAFSEALWIYWRILVASKTGSCGPVQDAVRCVELNKDPLVLCMMDRSSEAEDMLMGLLDGAFRSMCPAHQTVQREAYRAIEDDIHLKRSRGDAISLECETPEDYLKLFARCGVLPDHWVHFCEAFVWAVQTHTPYAQDDDKSDLERGGDSACIRAVAQLVALPAIKAYMNLKSLGENSLYQVAVPLFWSKLTPDDRFAFGETFYRTLLTKHPNLLDYFSKTDMDSLVFHFVASIDLIVNSASELGSADGYLRRVLDRLGKVHRTIGVPTYAYALVGGNLVECLETLFDKEEQETKSTSDPVTAKQLRTAFLTLYTEIMSMVYYPMLRHEKQVEEAREFYEQLQTELQWTDAQLSRRMEQVDQEIGATGTYTQTSEELEIGARLAWRNSAKCIGRISWNTLQVRDCRHINNPEEIFQEVQEHLKIATAGTNIQSVMTVFKPKGPSEPFGTRFWSSQYVRYAGYTKDENGGILGDPANLGITEYLLKNGYWSPPSPRTAFDVLPLVLKVPGKEQPYVYQLPKEFVFEVNIEHPTMPEMIALGYRWATVPAISNFKMNLGGVLYQNMPFNGWFMSTEIVRNLMERYDAGPAIAKVMGLDMASHPAWRQVVASELEWAIMHSFEKSGFTIVDPYSVGQQFCTHVRREREQFGRECPAQWSWIGGLTGPTNPTWHLEMRDFLIKPQYDYCAEGMLLHTSIDSGKIADANVPPSESSLGGLCTNLDDNQRSNKSVPRVLIAYGSETGQAEAVARRLKRQLNVLKPLLMSLNEVAGLDILVRQNISHLVCVCSTFGKGNAPSNSDKFFETDIANTGLAKYSVLALGSSLYPDFCQAGISLDKKLSGSGMEASVKIATADAASGAEGIIADWLANVKNLILPRSLESELLVFQRTLTSEPPKNMFAWESAEPTMGDGSPVVDSRALCVSNSEVIPSDAKEWREVRKITFQVPAGSSYETGDHLSVQPMNSDAMVRRFLSCFEEELVGYTQKGKSLPSSDTDAALEFQCKQPFRVECVEGESRRPADIFFATPTCLFDLVKSQLDLSVSRKDIVELLKLLKTCLNKMLDSLGKEKVDALEHPLVEEFIGFSSPILADSSEEKTGLIDMLIAHFPTLVNLLEHFKELFLEDFIAANFGREAVGPALKLPEILVIMSRLQPRFYSISSSHHTSPSEVTITVGVLKAITSQRVQLEGVCSHYLAGLQPGVDRAKVVVVKSSFRLPESKDAPLLMVGAGTGLSPMIGFLEDRALDVKNGHGVGEINLFFGCRTEKDFIYEETIRGYERSGMITLHLGLSRSPKTPKKYVQACIADMGKAASDLLMNKSTHYYVCGDARMADSCFEACVELLRKHQTMSRVKAVRHLRDMRVEGRWQTDVWGIVSHFEESKKSVTANKKIAAKIWLTHFRDDE